MTAHLLHRTHLLVCICVCVWVMVVNKREGKRKEPILDRSSLLCLSVPLSLVISGMLSFGQIGLLKSISNNEDTLEELRSLSLIPLESRIRANKEKDMTPNNDNNRTSTTKQNKKEKNPVAPLFPQDSVSNKKRFGELLPAHFINDCLVQANNHHIRLNEAERQDLDLPHFCSLQMSTDRYSSTENSQQPKKKLKYWMAVFSTVHIAWKYDRANTTRSRLWATNETIAWTCDRQPAKVVGGGCPRGTTFVVQCPQPADTQNISKIQFVARAAASTGAASLMTKHKMTYRVSNYVDCVRNEPLSGPNPRDRLLPHTGMIGNRVAGTGIFFGANTRNPHEILEWVEYHRMIGFEHFYLYLMTSYDSSTDWNVLPNLPYITWIPWDFVSPEFASSKNRARFLSFQIAQQTDAILRARADGIDWVAMNDLDEYLQLMDGSETLTMERYKPPQQILMRHNNTWGGVLGLTINFGQHPDDVTKRFPKPKFQLEYIYRAAEAYRRFREKVIVSTQNTDYYNNHRVSLGGHTNRASEWHQLRFVHYKRPEPGVSLQYIANKTIVYDGSLRDKYLDKLQSRVDAIKRMMIESNGGQIRNEWLTFDHLRPV